MVLGETITANRANQRFRENALEAVLYSVVLTHSRDGITIDEIIDNYQEITGDNLLRKFRCRDDLAAFLRTVPGVWCTTDGPTSPLLWYCNNNRSSQMMARAFQNQTSFYHQETNTTSNSGHRNLATNRRKNRRPRRNRNAQQYFDSAVQAPPSRAFNWRKNDLNFRKFGPSVYRHQLMGDDFFLALARWELGFAHDPGHSVQMSGLCISGLTLAEAARRVETARFINGRIIINIGTVDLLHGSTMTDLICDFENLMRRFRVRNVEPIVTTLAPIANCGGRTQTYQRLMKFNEYIRRHCRLYIDLWWHFANIDGSTRVECYQLGPRKVTGTIMPLVLWNKIGRHRVLDVLRHELGPFF